MDSEQQNNLRKAFGRFAQKEARELASPMYSELSRGVANDPDLLEIAAQVKNHQPAPNMLFAAVQYLLLKGFEHPLADYYPITAGPSYRKGSLFPSFRDFCLTQNEAIVELIRTRRTQTNVVRRCTCLLPLFSIVSEESGLPLALVDLGASAGLNLNFDRYYYRYQQAEKETVNWGVVNSRIHLETELRGNVSTPHLLRNIAVASRDGIDLDPVDLANSDQLLWLRALIWPEHTERHQQLIDAAIEFTNSDIRMHTGDAAEVLPTLISSVPHEHALVVYSTIALYQFPSESRKRVTQTLLEASEKRAVWQIALEGNDPKLSISRYIDGASHTEILADASPHGWWIKWREPDVR